MQHTVKRDETLSHLALRYYGNALRWQPIYEANREAIAAAQKQYTTSRFRPRGPHWIFPGTVLTIPDTGETK